MADVRIRKPRWLQFSIRTMLVATTLICLWFGWTVNAIHERRQLLKELLDRAEKWRVSTIDYNPSDSSLAWHRRALGDTYLVMVEFGSDAPNEIIERVKKVFPEAAVEQAR